MKKIDGLNSRKCNRTACFGNRFGYCDILTEALPKCTFFKTEQRAKCDRARAIEKLLEKPNGHELIEKYFSDETK